MIFTSVPLARAQSTSLTFKSYGANGKAPCTISETRISVVTTINSANADTLFSFLWAYTAAHLLKTPVPFDSRINACASILEKALFTNPPLVVTFPEKTENSTRSTQTSDLGFTKMSQNKYNFYKGPASDAAVSACSP